MSSTMSRFIVASTASKSITRLPTQNPSECLLLFNPISRISTIKHKEIACGFHGTGSRSLLLYTTAAKKPRMDFVVRSNVTPPPVGAPLPSGSPSGSLRSWLVGIVLTLVLPFVTHRWGPLLLLKNKVDTAIETAEHIMEAIEDVAEKVDNVVDNITDDLPEGSKLRKAMEKFDTVVEGVAKGAHVANDIIDKVEEAGDKLEEMMIHKEGKEKKEISEEAEVKVEKIEVVTYQEATISDQKVE